MEALQLTALICYLTVFQISFIDAFRSDYTFLESTYSYYKFYNKGAVWTDAKAQCESDGAIIFHPDNEAELLDVFRVLDVKKEMIWNWIRAGITNLDSLHVFKTVDGRLDSNVYIKWRSGEPKSCQYCYCVRLSTIDHTMVTNPCSVTWPFICKHTTEIKTTLGYANMSLNKTAELETLEQLTVNQTGEIEALKKRMDSMQQQNEYHFSILERLMEADVNQSAALERISQADTKQAADIKLLIEAMKHLIVNEVPTEKQISEANAQLASKQGTEAIEVNIADQPPLDLKEAVTKQAGALYRLALFLEKFVTLQSSNTKLDVQSEQ